MATIKIVLESSSDIECYSLIVTKLSESTDKFFNNNYGEKASYFACRLL